MAEQKKKHEVGEQELKVMEPVERNKKLKRKI